jgi:hypothetical protein
MITCAVVQPSYIPWRGYFDLILRSDIFVFYDDVQYDKHGWRNRNRIKTPRGLEWLTIPVRAKGNTFGVPINQIEIADNHVWNRKHLLTLRQNYGDAPYLEQYWSLLEDYLVRPSSRLVDLTIPLTIDVARELGATGEFVLSSKLGSKGGRVERLLSTIRAVGGTHYLSGPSAQGYLDPADFVGQGITIEFLDYDYPEYQQLHPPFEPKVSIVDLLFMLGPSARSAFRHSEDDLNRAKS